MFVFEIKIDKASPIFCRNGYLDAFNMIKNKKGYEVYKDYPTICVYLGNDRRIYGVDAFKKLSDTINGIQNILGDISVVRFFMLESWEYGHNIANVPEAVRLVKSYSSIFNTILWRFLKSGGNLRNQMALNQFIEEQNNIQHIYWNTKCNGAYLTYTKIKRNINKFDKINYVSYIGGHIGIKPVGYDRDDFDYKTYKMFDGKDLCRYTDEIADNVKKYIRANNSYKYM